MATLVTDWNKNGEWWYSFWTMRYDLNPKLYPDLQYQGKWTSIGIMIGKIVFDVLVIGMRMLFVPIPRANIDPMLMNNNWWASSILEAFNMILRTTALGYAITL